MRSVIVASGELRRVVKVVIICVAHGRVVECVGEDGRAVIVRVALVRIAGRRVCVGHGCRPRVVLGVVVEEGVGARRKGAVTAGVVVLGAVGVTLVVAVIAVVAVAVVLAARGLVLIRMDALICLVVMGSHGEGGLVGVDVLAAAELAVVIARQVAVEVEVCQGVSTDEGATGEEQAAGRDGVSSCGLRWLRG